MKHTICICNIVSIRELKKAIAKNGLTSLEEIKLVTKAGTSCGRCVENIKRILQETSGKNNQLKIDWD